MGWGEDTNRMLSTVASCEVLEKSYFPMKFCETKLCIALMLCSMDVPLSCHHFETLVHSYGSSWLLCSFFCFQEMLRPWWDTRWRFSGAGSCQSEYVFRKSDRTDYHEMADHCLCTSELEQNLRVILSLIKFNFVTWSPSVCQETQNAKTSLWVWWAATH